MKTFKAYLKEKVSVPSKSSTMGIDRREMPQIDSKHMSDFILYLKKEGVKTQSVKINPKNLRATQHQFHKAKVQSLMDKMEDGDYDEKPILVSKDNFVMDGHHRWLAALNLNKQIFTNQVNVPAKELIVLMYEFPKSYTKKLYESTKHLVENTSFKGTVYHGSGSRFERFEQSKARIPNDFYGGGVSYFTDNLKVAITYAKSMAKKTKEDPIIYTVKLNLRKVFDVDDVFTGKDLKEILPSDIDDFARGAGLLGLNSDKYQVLANLKLGNLSLTGDQVFKGLSKGMNTTAKAREHLISKGYDGLRYNGGDNMGMATKHNVYLVYDANDIQLEKRNENI